MSFAARPSGNIRSSSRIVVDPRISRPTSSAAAAPEARSPGIAARGVVHYVCPAYANTWRSAWSIRTAFRGSW